MMQGSFKGHVGGVLNLGDIFRSLANNRQSGTLIVTEGERQKKISFEAGAITLLSSSRRMRIGDLLIATGKITEDDLDLAIKLQKQNRKLLGEILVEEGFCDEEDIRRIVRYQVEGEIYDLFLWNNAHYEFRENEKPDELKGSNPRITRLQLDTNALIEEALARLEEWQQIQPLVPTTKDVFVLTGQAITGVDLAPALAQNLELCDGKTNLEQLAEKTAMSDFECCKQIARLVQIGAMRALSLDELAVRAEQAYAVNDFRGAIALYGRLELAYPDQIKLQIPLADSLRQIGDDQAAILMYQKIAQRLEADGKDVEGLKRCYQSIIQLDPQNPAALERLKQIEAWERQKRARRGRFVPVLLLLLALAGVVGLWVVVINAAKTKKTNDKRVNALLDEALAELDKLRASEDWKAAHAKGLEIVADKDFREHERTADLKIPLLVKTFPAGFEVEVNGESFGVTSEDKRRLVAGYDPRAAGIELKLYRVEGEDRRPVDVDIPRSLDPAVFHALELDVTADADWEYIGDADHDTAAAWSEPAQCYAIASRDGKLYRVKKGGVRRPPAISIGKYGDRVSGTVVDGSMAFVGLTFGGVARVDLGPENPPVETYEAAGPVTGRPVVTAERVAFGTWSGTIHIFDRKTRKRLGFVEGKSHFPHSGVALEAGAAIFAGHDGRLRRIDLNKAAQLEEVDLGASPLTAPVLCDVSAAVLLAGGVAAVTSASDFTTLRTFKVEAGKHPALAADTRRLFVSGDGTVQAYRLSDGERAWPQAFSVTGRGRARLALCAGRLVYAPGDRNLYALDPETGRLLWHGKVKTSVVAAPISVAGNHFLVGLEGLPVVRFTPFYGGAP